MTHQPMSKSARLVEIAGPCSFADRAALAPLIRAIQARHDNAVIGILFYGNCLRTGDLDTGLVDFYVVVDSYRDAHGSRISAVANYLVPPNVYWLAAGGLQCKYAVIDEAELAYGCREALTSGLWGRLAQPIAIVHAVDAATRYRLRMYCGQAVMTLLEESLPVLNTPMAPAELFAAALALSYGGELRAESGSRAKQITTDSAEEYARRAEAARDLLNVPVTRDDAGRLHWQVSHREQTKARRLWAARRPIGHLLSVARLSKACFTFGNAVDYAADKLARHTGVEIEVTERLRRHPLIYGWPVLWRLYRRGVLR